MHGGSESGSIDFVKVLDGLAACLRDRDTAVVVEAEKVRKLCTKLKS